MILKTQLYEHKYVLGRFIESTDYKLKVYFKSIYEQLHIINY